MSKKFSELSASIQQKLDQDTDFQSSIANLSEEDKEKAIDEKKSELLDQEIASLEDKATKAEKAEEVANNQKKRAEKAEDELKKLKPDNQSRNKKGEELSVKDGIYLAGLNLHPEDLDRVIKFATDEGISVQEAMKNDDLKAILDRRSEHRKSQEASNAGGSGRTTKSKLSDEELLANANKGIFPERGTKDAERLFQLRRKNERR